MFTSRSFRSEDLQNDLYSVGYWHFTRETCYRTTQTLSPSIEFHPNAGETVKALLEIVEWSAC
jgi:hypothetical protein